MTYPSKRLKTGTPPFSLLRWWQIDIMYDKENLRTSTKGVVAFCTDVDVSVIVSVQLRHKSNRRPLGVPTLGGFSFGCWAFDQSQSVPVVI